MLKKIKSKIYNVIRDDGYKSQVNRLVGGFIMALVIVNVLFVIVDIIAYEDISELPAYIKAVFYYFEVVTVAVFTVEYVLRLWTADFAYPMVKPAKARLIYARSFMAIIDLLAVLPFYLPFIFPFSLMALRLLRLFRLLRILKINRYSDARITEIVMSSIKEAIILIDASNNFLSANESAKNLFPSINDLKKNSPISQVQNWPGELIPIDEIKVRDPIQFTMPGDKFYGTNISPIYAKDLLLQYVVIIQDTTESVLLEKAEKDRINNELAIAARIQASMLPCDFPAFPKHTEFDICAQMDPAKEVGGDFYDFFFINENKLAVVIADVSGKGIPAAMFMVNAKTLIKNIAQQGAALEEVFITVNNLLCENNEECMFVTVFMGVLDIPSGLFSYVNAGHNVPLIKSGGSFGWLNTNPGLMLGFMEGSQYVSDEITLRNGDILFLYTDGVTEAENPENELFSEERLITIINGHEFNNLKGLLATIRHKIDSFANGADQSDDITMLALKISR